MTRLNRCLPEWETQDIELNTSKGLESNMTTYLPWCKMLLGPGVGLQKGPHELGGKISPVIRSRAEMPEERLHLVNVRYWNEREGWCIVTVPFWYRHHSPTYFTPFFWSSNAVLVTQQTNG